MIVYISTRNDVTIYFQPSENRTNVSILGHVRVAISRYNAIQHKYLLLVLQVFLQCTYTKILSAHIVIMVQSISKTFTVLEMVIQGLHLLFYDAFDIFAS